MKKIFTSIVVAFCAMSVNAQETIAVDAADNYTDGQVLRSENCTVTLGNDGGTWTAKPSNVGNFTAYVSGSNSPKDADGAGYKAENKNVPTVGTYYVVQASKNGTVVLGMVLNGNKSFYIAGPDGSSIPSSDFVIKDKDGNEVTLSTDNKASEKVYGTVEFKVAANQPYTVFCAGSKLGFYGVEFTPSGESAIANISADKANENAPVYNLNGQKVSKDYKGVVVKNGKKYVQK